MLTLFPLKTRSFFSLDKDIIAVASHTTIVEMQKEVAGSSIDTAEADSYKDCQKDVNPCDGEDDNVGTCVVATVYFPNGTCLFFENPEESQCAGNRATLKHTTENVIVTFYKSCGGMKYKFENEDNSAFKKGWY